MKLIESLCCDAPLNMPQDKKGFYLLQFNSFPCQHFPHLPAALPVMCFSCLQCNTNAPVNKPYVMLWHCLNHQQSSCSACTAVLIILHLKTHSRHFHSISCINCFRCKTNLRLGRSCNERRRRLQVFCHFLVACPL